MSRIKLKIKKGDTIQVIAGSQKGTKALVREVDPRRMRIKAQGIKMMSHYSRENGIQQMEGFIDYSNVKLVEPAASEAKPKKKKAKKS